MVDVRMSILFHFLPPAQICNWAVCVKFFAHKDVMCRKITFLYWRSQEVVVVVVVVDVDVVLNSWSPDESHHRKFVVSNASVWSLTIFSPYVQLRSVRPYGSTFDVLFLEMYIIDIFFCTYLMNIFRLEVIGCTITNLSSNNINKYTLSWICVVS
jgi:hypothetical protein